VDKKHPFFIFSKNLDFVWGVDRVRSRRELKDKNFCKIEENKCQDYCEKCEKIEKKKDTS